MNREQLIRSAESLKAPPASAAGEYGQRRDAMASEMNEIMLNREDVDSMVGPGNRAMMEDNHRNHARFMHSLFVHYVPEVFAETVLWVYRAYRAHGFRLSYWPAQLDMWVEVMRRQLSKESFEALYPFYEWMLVNQAAFVEVSDQMLEPPGDAPSHG